MAGAGPASGEGVAGGGGATLRKLRPIQVNLKSDRITTIRERQRRNLKGQSHEN